MSLFSFVATNGTLTVHAVLPKNNRPTGHASVTVSIFVPFEAQIQSKQDRRFAYKWYTDDARSRSHCCCGKARNILRILRVFCTFRYAACAVLYCLSVCLWPVPFCRSVPRYLIKCTIFGRKVTEHKICGLIFSTTIV